MADNSVLGLFTDPFQYVARQSEMQDQSARRFAEMTPMQQAQYGIYKGAGQLGGGLAGLMGVQDPQLQIISNRNAILRQIDQTDPQSILAGAKQLAQTDPQGASQLISMARDVERLGLQRQESEALIGQRKAQTEERQQLTAQKAARSAALVKQGYSAEEADAIASDPAAFREAMGLVRMPDKERADLAETAQANVLVNRRLDKANDYLAKVSGPKPSVYFGPWSNFKAWAESTGFVGEPSENTKAQDDVRTFIIDGVQGVLNAAKGVQAKDDAKRAETQILGYLKLNTNAGAEQALRRLKQAQEDVLSSNEAYIRERARPQTRRTEGGTGMSRRDELLQRASPEQRKALGL